MTTKLAMKGKLAMKSKLTTWILIAMLAGIGVGWMCHELLPSPESAKTVAGYISLVTDIFLRLIKMIIAPLVFTTLVVGIAHMGDSKSLGRIGLKTMGWFICASLLSLLLGMALVNILRPGDALTNQPIVFRPMRPSALPSPICAMPTTSVEKTSGAIIILMSRRKMSVTSEM